MPGGRTSSERPAPLGLPAVRMDERFVEALAAALAERIGGVLTEGGGDSDSEGYLNPEAAGRYLCISRRRVHDLTSSGLLTPDGYDGRTPLYRRSSLDRYVRGSGGGPKCRR